MEDPVWGYTATFQWFRGSRGDTSQPLGVPTRDYTSSISVSATTPAQYWLRVTSACATYDSEAVTVAGGVPTPSVNVLALLGISLAAIALITLRRV